ncbi:Hypothetical Protein FCC1311_101822 [Hondaea fermentalgiana]|uniref:Uncharacterized protein n=1 Tax=Hondaea fermentalgiana TaxID=2315210 RepID=A0A2R5GUF3_9STRA|nr:Hypothetical Protein FCC1311_101822 [Hondaea fermentalgiana]|eukprot:GBG33959.1 Hypothetical Protein FCC1311_101822 [Hondaea fermentalgiana]
MATLREARARVIAQPGWLDTLDVAVAACVRAFVEEEARETPQGELQPLAWEIIFDVIGEDFAETHFANRKRNRKLLEIPYLVPEMRVELCREVEMRLLAFMKEHLAADASQASFVKVCEQLALENPTGRADTLGAMLSADLAGHGHDLPLALHVGHTSPCTLVADRDKWVSERRESRRALLMACQGRSLPPSMRKYILTEALVREDLVKACEKHILQARRERDAVANWSESWVARSVADALRLLRTDADALGPLDFSHLETKCKQVLELHSQMTGRQHGSLALPLFMLLLDFPFESTANLLAMLERLREILPPRARTLQFAQSLWARIVDHAPDLAGKVRRVIEEHRAAAAAVEIEEPHVLLLDWAESALVGCVKINVARYVWMQSLIPGLLDAEVPSWDLDMFMSQCVKIFCLAGESIGLAQSVSELQRAVREKPRNLSTRALREAS